MSSNDQCVTAETIASVHGGICRRGPKPLLNDLAEQEPALAAYLLHGAAAAAAIANSAAPESRHSVVEQEVMARMLVAVESLRRAHYEMWCDVWNSVSNQKETLMSDQPKKISALAMATRSNNITVQWSAEDVRRFRPAWSGPEAQFFIDVRRKEIGEALLEVGIVVLEKLVESYEQERRNG